MAFDKPDNNPVTTFRGEQMTVIFSGTAVRSDYGVPGSPVWEEIDDIEIQSLEILGIEVDPGDLPKSLQTAIIELSDELEWES